MTLSKAMTEYLRYHALHKGGSPSSVEQYERVYRSFLAHLKGQGLNDEPRHFTGQTVLSWSLAEGERGVSARTMSSRLALLGSLARFMLRLKDARGRPLLLTDPTREFARPRYQRAPQAFLYPEELRAFLAVQRPLRESLVRDLFLDTMLRVSELAGADVGDWQETEGRCFLRVRVKGGQEKTVPVSPTVATAVQDYLLARGVGLGAQDASLPLLANAQGQRWTRTALTQLVSRIAKKAGITRFSVSAHKLRHTANVVARRAGVDQYTRSALLNHTDTRTVAQYDHLLPDELYDARVAQAAGLQTYLRGNAVR